MSRNNMPKPDEIQRNSKGRESKRFTSVGTLVLCADVKIRHILNLYVHRDTIPGRTDVKICCWRFLYVRGGTIPGRTDVKICVCAIIYVRAAAETLRADVNQSNYSFLSSDTASGIASRSDITSAHACVISTPNSPNRRGRIRISGIKNIPFREDDAIEAFTPFPID